METSPLICSANRWTGLCMIRTSVIRVLSKFEGGNILII